MSITEELRKWAHGFNGPWKRNEEMLLRIADRIDAEHERQLDVLYRDMSDAEWVRLPKDADGEYIHVGDEVETTNFGTVEVEGFVHRAVAFYDYSEQPARLCTTPANLCRHCHAPTVEDVLAEFAAKLIERGELTNGGAQTIAEYAAKLRLAEEDA